MKITALVRGKKSKRINVFLDDTYGFSVEETTLTRENLYKDKELSTDEVEKIKEKDMVEKFFFRSIEQIGRRPRSESEIERYVEGKLRNKKFYDLTKDEIKNISEKVLEKLKTAKYLNDEEFADWWVKSRNEHRPRGQEALKQELFKKGIDKELIKNTIAKNFDKEREVTTALDLAKKKLESSSMKNSTKMEKKAKVSRFLAGKGFKWETVSEIFKLLKL